MTDFHFLRPAWLLAIIPAAAIVWAALRLVTTRSAWRGLVDEHLLRALVVDAGGTTRRWPLGLVAAGFVLATLAMAGPAWERAPQPTADALAPTVVVLDMSPSMQADDVKPSRLARARFALQDVLADSAGGQVGLVLYSDEPYVASPLTDDARVVEEMIPTLTPDLMPAAGSRADRALALATDLLAQARAAGGRIVLLSDGVDEAHDATLAAARAAAAAGHTVSVVGIGTAEGTPVRDARGRLLRDADGRPALAPLDQAGLAAVADAGGGRYGLGVAGLLDSVEVSGTSRREGGPSVQADVWRDMGVWLVLALVLLAPFGFRRGWLALALLTLSLGSAEAATWSDLWARPDQQGATALAAGRTAEAAELFEAPSWKGAAHYQGGKFAEAAEAYRGLDDPESRYNLGNALARSGQLENALAAFDQVLAKLPDHEDARFNRELVQKLLDQQKEQQPDSKQQSSGASDQQQAGAGEQNTDDQQQADAGEQNTDAQQQADAGKQSADGKQQAAAGEQTADDQQQPAAGAGNGDDQHDTGEQRQASAQPDAREPEPRDGEQTETGDGTRSAGVETPPPSARGSAAGSPMTEQQQAREQMLRRIPDDPSGLLRAKIMRRYAEQRYAGQEGFLR